MNPKKISVCLSKLKIALGFSRQSLNDRFRFLAMSHRLDGIILPFCSGRASRSAGTGRTRPRRRWHRWERQTTSAVRIWGRQRCCVLVVVQIRFSFCTLSYCLRLKKDKANLRKFFHPCKSKTPSDAFFVNSATFCKFCHSPAPLYFSSPHKNPPFHRGNGGASSRARHLSAENLTKCRELNLSFEHRTKGAKATLA